MNYLRTAVAVLLRRKFFTFASLFGITFTLVVLMVVTALFDHMLRPGGPERDNPRMLDVNFIAIKSPDRDSSIHSSPGYLFLDQNVRKLTSPERISLFTGDSKAVSFATGERVDRKIRYTDAEYWRVLHFDFLEGAPFTAEDDRNGETVVVISEETRRIFFGEGASVVGRTLELDGRPLTIVGVVENVSPLLSRAAADAWLPIGAQPSTDYRTSLHGDFRAILLARNGSSDFPSIKREFRAMLGEVVFPDPNSWNWVMSAPDTRLESLAREMVGDREQFDVNVLGFVGIFAGAVLLFTLLPTINMVNLNLSRIVERTSEIGIRKSFGATARELVGQFLFENLVLTFIGGVLGAFGAVGVLRLLTASGLVAGGAFSFNLRIFAVGMLLIVFFGLLSGVYPAWRMSRLHPVEALRGRA